MTSHALLVYTWVAGLAACLAIIGIAAWYWWQERREMAGFYALQSAGFEYSKSRAALRKPKPFTGGLDWTLVDIRPLKEGDRVQWATLTGVVVAVHPGAGIVEFEDTHGIRRLADLDHVERIGRAA